MRKRARVSQPKVECHSEDCISQLPDDIIVSVLSRLTLKEAAITSSLSKRWRFLWNSVTGLDFDVDETLDKIAAEPKLRGRERPKYINWVNRVIRQHKGPTLDVLRICFDLDKSSKSAIDGWIKFAMSRSVQRLELELLEYGEILRQPSRCYTFPHKFLNKRKGFNHLTFLGFKFLKSLSLKSVNVSEETLNNILSDCLLLQLLCVHGSGDLVNVRVVGKSLKLKSLEIVFCLGVETIEISDANLVSFSYVGPAINLILENVPMLDEISIGEGQSGIENNVFCQISCCLSQLQVLTLDIYCPEENIKQFAFPELPKLEQLILKVGAWDDDSLLQFTSLINACPYLQRFVLQLLWMAPLATRRKLMHAANHPHQHLKLVEMVGYYGRTSDVELAMFFFDNASSLQKFVVDPRNQLLERKPTGFDEAKREEAARCRAKLQLTAKTPPAVQLVIL